MNQEEQNWMPLQSNPEVINTFIQKMGMRLDQYCFQQMLSIQDWALDMISKPVLGIILLFETSPAQKAFKEAEAASLNPQTVPNNIFFMDQFAHNACGTIALFHIIINALEAYTDLIDADCYIQKFRDQSQGKSPKEKGEIFKKSEQIKNQHKGASQEGQSQVQSDVDSHFIAFINKGNVIYELDGMKKCPVNHGQCTPEQFLTKGSAEIKKFMERDPENINFSMIVLAKKPE